MIDRKNKILLKDNLKRSILLKYKYLNLLQKSLFHNRSIKKTNRLIYFNNLNTKISYKKLNNICLINSEQKSVNKKLLLSRFVLNYTSILNNLQNFKINSF